MPNSITPTSTPKAVAPAHNPIIVRLTSDRVYSWDDPSCGTGATQDKPQWDLWALEVSTSPAEGDTLTVDGVTFTFTSTSPADAANCYDEYNKLHILIPAAWGATAQREQIVAAINGHPELRSTAAALSGSDTLTKESGGLVQNTGGLLYVYAKVPGTDLAITQAAADPSGSPVLNIQHTAQNDSADPSTGDLRPGYRLVVQPQVQDLYYNQSGFRALPTLTAPVTGSINNGLDQRAETDFPFTFDLAPVLRPWLTDDLPELDETQPQICLNAIRKVRWEYGEQWEGHTGKRITHNTDFRVLNCARPDSEARLTWSDATTLNYPDPLAPWFAQAPPDDYRRLLVDEGEPRKAIRQGEHEWIHFWVPSNEIGLLSVYIDRTFEDGSTDTYDPGIFLGDITTATGYDSNATGHLVRIPLTTALEDAWTDNVRDFCVYLGTGDPGGINGTYYYLAIPCNIDAGELAEAELGQPRVFVPSDLITDYPDSDCGDESLDYYDFPDFGITNNSTQAEKQEWLDAAANYFDALIDAWPETPSGGFPFGGYQLVRGPDTGLWYVFIMVRGAEDANLTYPYAWGVCHDGLQGEVSDNEDWYLGAWFNPLSLDDQHDIGGSAVAGRDISIISPSPEQDIKVAQASTKRSYRALHGCRGERLTLAYRNSLGVIDTLHLTVNYAEDLNISQQTYRADTRWPLAQPEDATHHAARPSRLFERQVRTTGVTAQPIVTVTASALSPDEAKHLRYVLRSPRLWWIRTTSTPSACEAGETSTELTPVRLVSEEHPLADTNNPGLLELEFELELNREPVNA